METVEENTIAESILNSYSLKYQTCKQLKKIRSEKYEKEICHVCLSVDRQLYFINQFLDLFNKLCDNTKLPISPLLCWECAAILKKVKKFQDNVNTSQTLLYYRQKDLQISMVNRLSKLEITNTTKIIAYTHIENSDDELNQNIKEELSNDEDKKVVNEIKEESECSDNEYNLGSNNTYFEDNGNSEVKTDVNDIVTVKKESVKKKLKRYKILIGKIQKKEIEQLTMKIPLSIEEVKEFLDKERCSEDYKQWEYKCETCVYGWHKERNLLEHKRRCHNLKADYECDICSKRFVDKRRLSLHIICHRYLHECRACAYRGSAFAMKRHLPTHDRLVQCLECDAKFPNIRQFYKHHKELHEVFKCDYCGKVCKSKSVIVKHISHNHGVFDCKICNARYNKRASYRQHVNIKHAVSNGDDAYCAPCDKRFFNVYVYRSHLKYSSAHAHERKGDRPEKKVACPDCGRIYSRKTYMMNHYRHVHMKRSNYHCSQCDKYFLNSTKYIDHMRYSHEGVTKEKNKLCNICGRGFAANRTLINHIRTHSGERPFECEHCGAKFTQKYAMISHVSHIHLKDKRKGCW